jgi:hypothetical protein
MDVYWGHTKNGSDLVGALGGWMLGFHQVIMCGIRYPNVKPYIVMRVNVFLLVLNVNYKQWIHPPLSQIP